MPEKPEGFVDILGDLDSQESWVGWNFMKYTKGNSRALHVGRTVGTIIGWGAPHWSAAWVKGTRASWRTGGGTRASTVRSWPGRPTAFRGVLDGA